MILWCSVLGFGAFCWVGVLCLPHCELAVVLMDEVKQSCSPKSYEKHSIKTKPMLSFHINNRSHLVLVM